MKSFVAQVTTVAIQQLHSVTTASRAFVGRSVDAIRGSVMLKRCSRCRHMLSRGAIVCQCGKWQG